MNYLLLLIELKKLVIYETFKLELVFLVLVLIGFDFDH